MNIINYAKRAILAGQTPLISSIITGFVSGVILLALLVAQSTSADLSNNTASPAQNSVPVKIVKNGHLTICKINKSSYEVVKKIKMILTAYSSTQDQTDDTPFVTASGKTVADGVIANNMLPFGTKVKIPALFGDKIFIVEDRMHSRKGKYQADIWMPEYSEAKNFGAKLTEIEVLES